MQLLEVSGAVRPIYGSLDVKRFRTRFKIRHQSIITHRLQLRVVCIVNIYLVPNKSTVLSSASRPLYFLVNTLVMIQNTRKNLKRLIKITCIFPDMFGHLSIRPF